VETISREELEEKMDRGDNFVLVDTLAEMYYRHSHLPGAINVPVDALRERAPELLPDKQAEIIVYCMDPPCQASEEAASELEAMGYGNARDSPAASRTLDRARPSRRGPVLRAKEITR
jgi:rhodanese-related sulfurtransferase